MVGGNTGNDENTDLEVLANGPNWNQVEINTDDGATLFQWNRRNRGGGGGTLIMLNADIAIVRDLENQHDGGDAFYSFLNRNGCPLADIFDKGWDL